MKAVVLFNLGGPTSLDNVEPFLFNLFSDPDIIRLPRILRFMQKPLATRISRRRGPEARKNYELIGGRSPLLENTRKQADALAAELGEGYQVHIAMRYWEPLAADTVAALQAAKPDEVIYLPLYPQFSIATTASSRNDFTAAMQAADFAPPVKEIRQWYDRPGFAALVADSIREVLPHVELKQAHILFSAHGLPVSYVTKYGDPYQKQTEETVAAVMQELNTEIAHSLCYQSRVGPVKWLEPNIDTAIEQLAQQGVKTLIVYPISFVSEHVETLYELDLLYGEKARALGLDYRRIHTLGDRPEFIRFLAQLVREADKQ